MLYLRRYLDCYRRKYRTVRYRLSLEIMSSMKKRFRSCCPGLPPPVAKIEHRSKKKKKKKKRKRRIMGVGKEMEKLRRERCRIWKLSREEGVVVWKVEVEDKEADEVH